MDMIFENKLIAEARRFGFKPRQHEGYERFIKSRDQFKTWHILYTRKYWIYLCDRYFRKKNGEIVICKVTKVGKGDSFSLDRVYKGKVSSVKFFTEVLQNVGCKIK